jgi:hypothetical protein
VGFYKRARTYNPDFEGIDESGARVPASPHGREGPRELAPFLECASLDGEITRGDSLNVYLCCVHHVLLQGIGFASDRERRLRENASLPTRS